MEVGNLYRFYGKYEFCDDLIGIFEGTDPTTGFLMFKDVCFVKFCNNSKTAIDHICREISSTPGDWAQCEERAKKILSEWIKTNKAPKEAIFRKEAQYNLNCTQVIIPMKSYFEEA